MIGNIERSEKKNFPLVNKKSRSLWPLIIFEDLGRVLRGLRDQTSMINDFKAVNWESIYDAEDVKVALNYFNDVVKTVIGRHTPYTVKMVKGKFCPRIHHDLRESMKDRDLVSKKAHKTKNDDDWYLSKCLRNMCNNKLKSAKSSFQRIFLKENTSTNTKKFWKIIKEALPFKSTCESSITSITGENQKKQANIFSSYFVTAVRELKDKSFLLTDFVWRCLRNITLYMENCKGGSNT